MQERIKEKLPLQWVYLLAVPGLLMALWMTNYESQYLHGWAKYAALGGFSLFAAVFAWGLEWARVRAWKAEHVFLLLFVPLSLAMMAILPVNRVPDEEYHLLRIWQISIGQWFPNAENQGVFYQPVNLNDGWGYRNDGMTLTSLAALPNQMLDTSEYILSNVETNTGVYPVNNYLPQALGLAIFRLFTNNRILMMYGARLGAWIVTVLLLYYAVKRLPFGKYTAIVISLFPTMLQESASASADGMTVAAVFAFLALVLDLRVNKRVLKAGDMAMLAFLTVSVATLKILYVPLVFLLLAIPAECFGSRKRKGWHAAWMILLSVGLVVGWLLLCKAFYFDHAAASETKDGNVLPQIRYILHNPARYLLIVAKTFLLKIPNYGGGMIGVLLSWYNVSIPYGLIGLQVLAIGGVFLCDRGMTGQRLGVLRHQLWWTAVASVLIIFTSLYIWWCPYASGIVNGVQGRYFTPLLLGVVMALRGSWSKLEWKELTGILTALMGLLDVAVLFSVFLQVFG